MLGIYFENGKKSVKIKAKIKRLISQGNQKVIHIDNR